MIATIGDDGAIKVKGDPDHPANQGRLCSKGTALADTLSAATRLATPQIDGAAASWDDAIALIAQRFGDAARDHGPGSIAAYLSGQMLTEDYYVANKLFKGFLGSPNLDTNSRLCMASAVVAHKRAFGEDLAPVVYEDLELADLVVLVGSNLAWCHPVLFQRLVAARKARGTKVVVVDPRRTATCEIADLHLALKPGADVKLFNGLLAHLDRCGAIDWDAADGYLDGWNDARAAAQADAPSVAATAEDCGLSTAEVGAFFALVHGHERMVTAYSQGVNQSSRGVDKANAILNLHLATGRFGAPGAGPFSVTGQPNAMGGREVGGLANQLAAHMDFTAEDVDRVGRFWSAPAMATQPGLKAVDLFAAAARGEIQALWIMATNPAVSLPDAGLVRAALEACPFVVVSDCYGDGDTARYADVLLPATGWSEKDGTVTESDRIISRQRALRAPHAQSRHDWAQLAAVGRALGHDAAFAWPNAAAVFREHAALSGFENDGARLFDIGPLADLSDADYETLAPTRWPLSAGDGRLFADRRFPTPNGRARMLALTQIAPENAPDGAYPLVLNTGRYRDQWHTMTRSGLAPQLNRHRAEPLLEIHPADAAAADLEDGGFADVASAWGAARMRVRFTPDQARGQVFAPMHWSLANSSAGGVGPIVNPAVDPLSGQPESKHTPCRIAAWRPERRGFAVARRTLEPATGYWTRWTGADGVQVYEIAGTTAECDAFAAALADGAEEVLDYADARAGAHRRAWLRDGALNAALYIGVETVPNARERLVALCAADVLSAAERTEILAGRAAKPGMDPGPIVCACAGVGAHMIAAAIDSGRATTVDCLGAQLNAGVTCGSCRPELKAMIDAARRDDRAAA